MPNGRARPAPIGVRSAGGWCVRLGCAGAALVGAACHAPTPSLARVDVLAAERAALGTLFLEREHARQLVLYRGPRRDGPALGDLVRGDSLAPGLVDARGLALAVPVQVVDAAALEAHFRTHPAAWDAWYARYPASGGVIEFTAPRMQANARASLVVGRLCGEHCRMAWRVVVRRGADGAWRTDSVAWLRVPRM